MLQTIIITILIILLSIFIMSLGYLITGKKMKGSCGNSADNPCDCTLAEKIKCSLKS